MIKFDDKMISAFLAKLLLWLILSMLNKIDVYLFQELLELASSLLETFERHFLVKNPLLLGRHLRQKWHKWILAFACRIILTLWRGSCRGGRNPHHFWNNVSHALSKNVCLENPYCSWSGDPPYSIYHPFRTMLNNETVAIC